MKHKSFYYPNALLIILILRGATAAQDERLLNNPDSAPATDESFRPSSRYLRSSSRGQQSEEEPFFVSNLEKAVITSVDDDPFENASSTTGPADVEVEIEIPPEPPKPDDENGDLFEGDIIPLMDEIMEDYGEKTVKELQKRGLLPPDDSKTLAGGSNNNHHSLEPLGGAQTAHLWNTRVNDVIHVPYAFASNHFSSSENSQILEWMNDLSKASGIVQFIPRTNQQDFIYIQAGDGCSSFVGRTGQGGQALTLARSGCLHKGTVQHELIHALGFYHEQSRSDRDSYVRINFENIQSGLESNFEKRNTNSLGSSYDYASVMHYPKDAFTKNGRDTITSPVGIGQRDGPTTSDIIQIRLLYQCKSGPRSLSSYQSQLCTSDCPCWEGAQGCGTSNSACQGDLVCNSNTCTKSGGSKTFGPYYVVNAYSNRRLYANSNKNYDSGFGAHAGSGYYTDQQWYFIETSHDGKMAYYIRNFASGRYLYANSGSNYESAMGAYSSGFYSSQKWLLFSTSYNGRSGYIIENAYSSRRMYAQSGKSYRDGVGAISTGNYYDDQKWVLYTPQSNKVGEDFVMEVFNQREGFILGDDVIKNEIDLNDIEEFLDEPIHENYSDRMNKDPLEGGSVVKYDE